MATLMMGWFAVAPAVVLCTCTAGHTTYALQTHDEPACGHHDHSLQQDEDQDPATPVNHEDEKALSDSWRPSKSDPGVPPIACSAVLPLGFEAVGADHALASHLSRQLLGPPESVRAVVVTTILLI